MTPCLILLYSPLPCDRPKQSGHWAFSPSGTSPLPKSYLQFQLQRRKHPVFLHTARRSPDPSLIVSPPIGLCLELVCKVTPSLPSLILSVLPGEISRPIDEMFLIHDRRRRHTLHHSPQLQKQVRLLMRLIAGHADVRLIALCATQCGQADASATDGAFVHGVPGMWCQETFFFGTGDDTQGDAVFRRAAGAVEVFAFGEDGAVGELAEGGDLISGVEPMVDSMPAPMGGGTGLSTLSRGRFISLHEPGADWILRDEL